MITKETVLILGAGASADYGFPLGFALYRRVCDMLREEKTRFKEFGFEVPRVDAFLEALWNSGASSVDAFLEHRTEFIDIGKVAIACALLPSESPSRLFDFEVEDRNWYKYLWSHMNTEFDNLHQNKISIITYNYDRSCEHFLFTAMKNTYGQSESNCVDQLRRIPIVHLHGQLGPLPWQAEGGIPYSASADAESVRKAAHSIKIIHEAVANEAAFAQAKDLFQRAEVVYFLGFGYNETNVNRLKEIGLLQSNARILGTRWQMGEEQVARVRSMLAGKIQIYHTSYDILRFFHHVAGLE